MLMMMKMGQEVEETGIIEGMESLGVPKVSNIDYVSILEVTSFAIGYY
jgi:hypothetical protein